MSSNDFISDLKRHEKALTKANAANKEAVFDALAQAGITAVSVEFDGEGDSGQIESVIATTGDKPAVLPCTSVSMRRAAFGGEAKTVKTTLAEAVEELCYDYLSQEHGGWENNDGAFGTFTLTVAARTVELEFNGRYTDTFMTNHTF